MACNCAISLRSRLFWVSSSLYSSEYISRFIPAALADTGISDRKTEMKGIGFLKSIGQALPDMSLGSAIRHVQMMRGKGPDLVRIQLRKFPGLSVEIRSHGSDRWTFREVFVKHVYGDVLRQLGTCRRFVDLGANIGLSSLYFSWRFPEAEFLAVEANEPTFAMLSRNLEKARLSGRATLMCAAAWSHDGVVAGCNDGATDHYSRFSVGPVPAGAAASPALIPARRVETLLDGQGWDEVDLIKIDIEGAEVELFRSDATWLRRTRCIAIEFHDDSARACDWPAVLERHGLREISLPGAHTAIGVRC